MLLLLGLPSEQRQDGDDPDKANGDQAIGDHHPGHAARRRQPDIQDDECRAGSGSHQRDESAAGPQCDKDRHDIGGTDGHPQRREQVRHQDPEGQYEQSNQETGVNLFRHGPHRARIITMALRQL